MSRAAYELYGPRSDHGTLMESYESAARRRTFRFGRGVPLRPELELPYLCDVLGLRPSETEALDRYDAAMLLAYEDGKSLGEWACIARPDG